MKKEAKTEVKPSVMGRLMRRFFVAYTFVAVPCAVALAAVDHMQSAPAASRSGLELAAMNRNAFSCKPNAPMIRPSPCRVW